MERATRQVEKSVKPIALGLILLTGCAAPPADPPVALYAGGEVTAGEYRSWLEFAGVEDDAERRTQVLREIATQETLAAAARRRGVADRPEARLALLDLESRLLEDALRRDLGTEAEIGDDEIDRWLAEHGQRMVRPRRVRLSNIFKRFDGGSAATLRATMADLRRQLVDGADFAELARRESDSQTRFRQGRIGVVKPGFLEPAIEEVAFALAPDEISEVIETSDGLTILRCDGVEEEVRPSEEDQRQRAAARLRRQHDRERWQAVRAELLAPVRLDLAAAQLASTAPDTTVVEADGGWSLSLAEIELLLRRHGVRRRPADLPEARLRDLLETLAVQRQAAERARNLGLGNDSELAAKLHWSGELELAVEEMKNRVEARFKPLEEGEIRAYFESHRERYQVAETFRLAAIRLRAERADLRQRYRLGERLETDLRAGRLSFAEAAERHSELPSASRGGLLGWLDRQQVAGLGPNVLSAVTAMSAGEVSRLIQQPDSLPRDGHTLWLVQLLDRRPPRPMAFEEARGQAENALGNERARELQRLLEAELAAGLDLQPVAED